MFTTGNKNGQKQISKKKRAFNGLNNKLTQEKYKPSMGELLRFSVLKCLNLVKENFYRKMNQCS